jgi:hypothetical protein
MEKYDTARYSMVQHKNSKVQHITPQYSVVPQETAWDSKVQHGTAQFSMVRHSADWHSMVQYSAV